MMGRIDRRNLMRGVLVGAAAMAVAACIPRTQAPVTAPPPKPAPPVETSNLPPDALRHRIALLVPLTGVNARVGQSIANATTMALIDTNAANLRITTYDTATGASAAAARALQDGNRLILGPLLSEDVSPVVTQAAARKVPVISYSNDDDAAGDGVYLMGQMPAQSIARTVDFAHSKGLQRFGILVPTGVYGTRAAAAFEASVRRAGGTVVASEGYDRGNVSVVSAVRRLKAHGAIDAVLVPDTSRIALIAAAPLKAGSPDLRVLGTELWSGEAAIAHAPVLQGAWFSAVSDARFAQFSESYRRRFGAAPFRIATLGYDSVLLTLRVARGWKPGTPFPTEQLSDQGGFIGIDGAFRFGRNGIAERAMEVREVGSGAITAVSPAPTRFGG